MCCKDELRACIRAMNLIYQEAGKQRMQFGGNLINYEDAPLLQHVMPRPCQCEQTDRAGGFVSSQIKHDLGPVEKSFPFEPPWMAEIEQFLRVG